MSSTPSRVGYIGTTPRVSPKGTVSYGSSKGTSQGTTEIVVVRSVREIDPSIP